MQVRWTAFEIRHRLPVVFRQDDQQAVYPAFAKRQFHHGKGSVRKSPGDRDLVHERYCPGVAIPEVEKFRGGVGGVEGMLPVASEIKGAQQIDVIVGIGVIDNSRNLVMCILVYPLIDLRRGIIPGAAIFPGGLRAVTGINMLLFLRLIGADMTGKRSVFGTNGPFWEKRRAYNMRNYLIVNDLIGGIDIGIRCSNSSIIYRKKLTHEETCTHNRFVPFRTIHKSTNSLHLERIHLYQLEHCG